MVGCQRRLEAAPRQVAVQVAAVVEASEEFAAFQAQFMRAWLRFHSLRVALDSVIRLTHGKLGHSAYELLNRSEPLEARVGYEVDEQLVQAWEEAVARIASLRLRERAGDGKGGSAGHLFPIHDVAHCRATRADRLKGDYPQRHPTRYETRSHAATAAPPTQPLATPNRSAAAAAHGASFPLPAARPQPTPPTPPPITPPAQTQTSFLTSYFASRAHADRPADCADVIGVGGSPCHGDLVPAMRSRSASTIATVLAPGVSHSAVQP